MLSLGPGEPPSVSVSLSNPSALKKLVLEIFSSTGKAETRMTQLPGADGGSSQGFATAFGEGETVTFSAHAWDLLGGYERHDRTVIVTEAPRGEYFWDQEANQIDFEDDNPYGSSWERISDSVVQAEGHTWRGG